nr:hypothetical protein [Tanacetum cinerariifolium]
MLAPGNYVQWKSRIMRYIDTKPNYELIHYCLTNPPYELGIDNDIYSTVDACPNACEMWKAIERLKQGESINVQDLETNLFWEFGKFTSQDGESLESYYSRNRGKAIVNSPQPIYDQEPSMVDDDDDDDTSKENEIDKLMALIYLSFKKIYKPTNNNLRTSSNTSRANQDNSPRIHRNAGYEHQRLGNVAGAKETVAEKGKRCSYHREKMLLCKQEEAGIQLNAEHADWKDDTDDEYDDQELEAHYMYMAKIQEVSPYAIDSGPIFDTEPEQKVQNDDHYDVFAIECQHPEQSESVHKIYLIEQDALNVIIESVDMHYDSEQIDQNDEDVDLAKERELLASLIEKLKCEIDETKNRNALLETSNKVLIKKLKCKIDETKNPNTLLETSNKVLVEKLKSEIEDFKNKNKSLKKANNKLSKENDLLYADFKKSKAELKRRDNIEYATEIELECAKVK